MARKTLSRWREHARQVIERTIAGLPALFHESAGMTRYGGRLD
ncbi:MAG TPA: hypothetical protein VKS79_21285 [Gemmataceae bacterium]|nr:hypothetical protein [Gemmataceae bacterium]